MTSKSTRDFVETMTKPYKCAVNCTGPNSHASATAALPRTLKYFHVQD